MVTKILKTNKYKKALFFCASWKSFTVSMFRHSNLNKNSMTSLNKIFKFILLYNNELKCYTQTFKVFAVFWYT
jgi:hypothetical protein